MDAQRASQDVKANTIEKKGDYTYSEMGYMFVVIAACGMSLGCRLGKFKKILRGLFRDVGLMRDALIQMEEATHPERGYKDGTPWDFGSEGLTEVQLSFKFPAPKDRLAKNHFNVRPPGVRHEFDDIYWKAQEKALDEHNAAHVAQPSTRSSSDSTSHDDTSAAPKLFYLDNDGPLDRCGSCGAAEGKDQKQMLTCSGCKRQQYCSTKCQDMHLMIHKHVCNQPTPVYIVIQAMHKLNLRKIKGESEDERMTRRTRVTLSQLDPTLVRKYIDLQIRRTVVKMHGEEVIAAKFPKDWATTLRNWYHRPHALRPFSRKELHVIALAFYNGSGPVGIEIFMDAPKFRFQLKSDIEGLTCEQTMAIDQAELANPEPKLAADQTKPKEALPKQEEKQGAKIEEATAARLNEVQNLTGQQSAIGGKIGAVPKATETVSVKGSNNAKNKKKREKKKAKKHADEKNQGGEGFSSAVAGGEETDT